MKTKILTLLAITLIFTTQTWAVHIGNVTITDIRLFNTKALVYTNKDINAPGCATYAGAVVVPLDNTAVGNRRLAVLLAAHAQQKVFNPNCNECDSSIAWLGSVTQCHEVRIR